MWGDVVLGSNSLVYPVGNAQTAPGRCASGMNLANVLVCIKLTASVPGNQGKLS